MPKNLWERVLTWFWVIVGVVVLVVVVNGVWGWWENWWDDRYNRGPVIGLSATATPRPPPKILGVRSPFPEPTRVPFKRVCSDMMISVTSYRESGLENEEIHERFMADRRAEKRFDKLSNDEIVEQVRTLCGRTWGVYSWGYSPGDFGWGSQLGEINKQRRRDGKEIIGGTKGVSRAPIPTPTLRPDIHQIVGGE